VRRFLILLLALTACSKATTPTAQPSRPVSVEHSSGADAERARWQTAKIDKAAIPHLDKLVARYQRTQSVYQTIEHMRRNGVPARVVFALLYREADNDMTKSPAQGDPLNHRSIHVPKGRIPGKNPPYTFLESAEDSYYSPELDHLDTKNWSEIGAVLWNCVGFNGLGYTKRGLPSPYAWSMTTAYLRGKYVSDGRFDPLAVDKQAGVAAILKQFEARGVR